MNKEESQKLYEGKYFYEIVKSVEGSIELLGPLDNLYYTTSDFRYTDTDDTPQKLNYEFVQVIDGKPVQAFTREEILVLYRRL